MKSTFNLIDTHAHLFWESFIPDLDAVIERAAHSGITTIINVGVDVKLSKKAAELESKKVKFYSTIGIHPHEAVKFSQNPVELIKSEVQMLEEIYYQYPHKVVAIGECGLDFLFESNPDWVPNNLTVDQIKTLQIRLFNAQIGLAKKLNLPLVVHCRDDRTKNPENIECWLKCLEMVEDNKGILHCYSGLPPVTQKIPPGFLVSFAGNITYPKNDYLKEAAKSLPLDKISLETDCPFLAPQSKRGQRNEPSSVKEIAELIAQIKGVSAEIVASQTTQNVKNLLNLK